jgi:uncharacterized membrane protein YeiB
MTSAEFSKPVPGWTRLDGVDLLRGLAIFFVLMNHVNMRLPKRLGSVIESNETSGVEESRITT